MLNVYKAFYKGKEIDIEADTSYHAQLEASKMFKAKKSYQVTVMLWRKGLEQVTHKPLF